MLGGVDYHAIATAVRRTFSLSWRAKYFGCVSLKDFGAIGDGQEFDTQALNDAHDYLNALAQPCALIIPAGIYKYTVSPNWAIQDLQIISLGEVRMRYAGTGNAFIVDGGAAGAGIFNTRIGRLLIEAPTTAQNGVYLRSIHHGDFGFKVLGAGAAYAGIRVEWCVCTNFHQPTVSINEEGWYTGAKPQYGMIFTRRGAGADYSAYCKVYVPTMESVDTGIWCDYATGIKVNDGTLEGCTSMGFNASANSQDCKVKEVDFESNTTRDIYDQGLSNSFIDCDTLKLVTIDATASNGRLSGGRHSQISVVAGATQYNIQNVRYNRLNDGSTIDDQGTRTRLTNNTNIGTGAQDDSPSNVLAKSAVAVACPADVTEDVLATITVPARRMGPNGRLRITCVFGHTNSGNNKTLNVRYSGGAGTTFVNVVATNWVSSHVVCEIANRNATNSQVGSAYGATSSGLALATQKQTAAVDTTAATTVVITGQKAVGGETLTLESYCVELLQS